MTYQQFADKTAPPREGETLDTLALDRFLRSAIANLAGDIEVEQFPGGHSNLTYLVRYGDREFVLRRPPFGTTVKSAHDMGREYAVLSRIHDRYPPAPQPVAICEDESIIGAKFYAMERIPGVVFRVRKPDGLSLTRDQVAGISQSFTEGLADMHALDWRAAGLDVLYKGPGYVERQVRGWATRWTNAKTAEVPEMTAVEPWLEKHLPPDSDAALIHNDYKFDNLVFGADDITQLAGVLDWEMATIGDPLSDLAVTLTTFTKPEQNSVFSVSQCFLNAEPGCYSQSELIDAYAEASGRDVSNLLYYYVLALYKGAVIIEQIYHRYHHGMTKDERFAVLHHVTKSLAQRAHAAMQRGEII